MYFKKNGMKLLFCPTTVYTCNFNNLKSPLNEKYLYPELSKNGNYRNKLFPSLATVFIHNPFIELFLYKLNHDISDSDTRASLRFLYIHNNIKRRKRRDCRHTKDFHLTKHNLFQPRWGINRWFLRIWTNGDGLRTNKMVVHIKSSCLSESNLSIFICKHHTQDATLQNINRTVIENMNVLVYW
jgi:hypothetical protein